MATYTSYLNLEKPAVGETFNLLKINQNWDKIDQGVSALNSKFTTATVTQPTNANGIVLFGYKGQQLIACRASDDNYVCTPYYSQSYGNGVKVTTADGTLVVNTSVSLTVTLFNP